MIEALCFGAGAAAGALQTALLRRSARGRGHALSVFLRLLVVGLALVLSALGGHLLAGALGWSAAFVTGSALVLWRWS